MTFYDYLKNVFFILIILQIAPPLIENVWREYARRLELKTQVGEIRIAGMLQNASEPLRVLKELFTDTSVKAILIHMECEGGASGTSQTIFNEIVELKKEHPKPVVALVENLCASGGFWVACASDYIVAPGTALIGSIGASFPYMFQLKPIMEEYKLGYVPMYAGAYKGATDPLINMSEQDKAMLQNVLDDSYQQFVQSVAVARKISPNNASEWAEGKLFNAAQALKLGLIDEIGSLSTAIKAIKERALVEGEIEWIRPRTARSFWTTLMGQQTDADGNGLFTAMLTRVCTFLESRYAKAIKA